jgi:hypothetical protein
MKNFIVLSFILLCAAVARADTLVELKSGVAYLWTDPYVKGDQYCTTKRIGVEICVGRNEIRKVSEKESGTVDPKEVGIADTASLQDMSDNMYAAQYEKNEVVYKQKRSSEAKEEKQKSRDRARKVLTYGESRVREMELSGNSVR